MGARRESVQGGRASRSKHFPSRSGVSILHLMLAAERRDLPAARRTSRPSAVRKQTYQPDLTSLRRITQAKGSHLSRRRVFPEGCQEESEPEGRPFTPALIYQY